MPVSVLFIEYREASRKGVLGGKMVTRQGIELTI
jgi:hypothetical protein